MNIKLFISISIFILFAFISCTEENSDYEKQKDNDYPNIEIDSLKYSYISPENNYYYNGQFKSKDYIQAFNLDLKENRKYRISSSQSFSDISKINLSLLTGNDTITVSQNINNQQVLYFNSSNYQKLILKAQLQDNLNISLDYNIYFEELNNDTLSIKDYQFTYTGHYTDSLADSCLFYPSKSYWYKWLRLNRTISNNKNISYCFNYLNEESTHEFGFILGGSESLTKGNIFDDNLANGIFFNIIEDKYFIYSISNNSVVLLEQGTVGSPINYNQIIKVDIISDLSYINKKNILINGVHIAFIDQEYTDYFYLINSDRAESKLNIFDFSIE